MREKEKKWKGRQNDAGKNGIRGLGRRRGQDVNRENYPGRKVKERARRFSDVTGEVEGKQGGHNHPKI